MSDLLPREAADFTSPDYWKKFFAQRKLPFEWYGDYASLSQSIERYIKVADQILQLGCGSSNFASELYDNGFRHVHSVDIEDRVIADQKRKNAERSELTFAVEDATSLSSSNGSKNIVVDKGTLDALLPPGYSNDQLSTVHKMFEEVDRILMPNGRYVVITLAQEHIVQVWHAYFSSKYLLEVQEVPTRAKGFCMPVFLLVAMKLARPMPIPISFVRSSSSKPERMDERLLYENIRAEQELSRFVAMCSQKLNEEAVIRMGDVPDLGPRYTFTIVDKKESKEIQNFSCFIVPLGKDGEWLFSNPGGRQCLLSQAQCDRLMITTLNRRHSYGDYTDIKAEINDFISRFDPRPGQGEISILSIGAVDARKNVLTGTSEVNGKWLVEEISREDLSVRQLIFENNTNLIQSEAFLKKVKDKMVLDTDQLACAHHYMMIASLGLHASQPLRSIPNSELKVAVLGLGGGLLASFLLQHFPRISLTAIELDKEMVDVASRHFGFPKENKRVTVKVMDALQYLADTAAGSKNAKQDVIFVDVAGAMDENGLSCPPAAFLESQVLDNMKKSLRNNGILALNLVTRNKEIAERYRQTVRQFFPKMFHLEAEEDINELLIGVLSQNEQPDVLANAVHLQKAGKTEWKGQVAGWMERIKPYC